MMNSHFSKSSVGWGFGLTIMVGFVAMLIICKETMPMLPPPKTFENVGSQCQFACLPDSLVCKAGTCDTCITDVDCKYMREDAICEGWCRHKHLLPLNSGDILTAICYFVVVFIAAGNGTGGSSSLVALFVLISHFSPHEAVPISRLAAVGGNLYNFIYFFPKKHPTANRPMISYDLCFILEPMTLAGTSIGVLMNHVLPEWFILAMVSFFMCLTVYRTGVKGIEVWEKESEQLSEATPLIVKDENSPSAETPATELPTDSLTEEEKRELSDILVEEANPLPANRLIILFFIWVFMSFVSLVRGGATRGYVECGGVAYWLVFFLVFPFTFGISFYFQNQMIKRQERKVALKYPFQRGDIQWTEENKLRFMVICSVGGVLSGILNVSGGVLKGPIMLELGVLPQVVASSTAFMGLMTSTSITMQFLLLNDLEYQYALLYLFIGFFGTICGQHTIGWFIKKYKKTAIIVFSLTLVLAISVVLMLYVGVRDIIRREHMHQPDGFRDLC